MQLAQSKLYKGRSGGDAGLKMDQAAGAFYNLTDDEMSAVNEPLAVEWNLPSKTLKSKAIMQSKIYAANLAKTIIKQRRLQSQNSN